MLSSRLALSDHVRTGGLEDKFGEDFSQLASLVDALEARFAIDGWKPKAHPAEGDGQQTEQQQQQGAAPRRKPPRKRTQGGCCTLSGCPQRLRAPTRNSDAGALVP